MGRSEAGKTSLVQALKGEPLHYTKTQYTLSGERVIASPGEYSETKNFARVRRFGPFAALTVSRNFSIIEENTK